MANFNYNKVILGGRLTSDPELKTTQSGTAVTTFSVAVNRKVGKDQEQKTDFITCVAWRNTAEFIARYFHKGSCICVTGSLQQRQWQDKDGNKRYATEVIVDEANFVDGKRDADSADESSRRSDILPTDEKIPLVTPHFEEMANDDDLPF